MSDGPARKIARRVRQRHVVPWTAAYAAGAWLLVESTSYLTQLYGGPGWIEPTLVIVLAFGVFTAMTVAWFHGESGWQGVTRKEVVIHSTIAVALLATLALVPPNGGGETAAEADLPATRVAVLYFKDHSADASLTPLTSDLTEAVVHRLAQVPALDVLPLTAVEAFRGTRVAYDSILSAVRAGSLVEGSITTIEDDLVVTTQVFEAESQVHRASWVYARPDTMPATIVTEVADSIADQIRQTIGRQVTERQVLTSTDVPEAMTLYRRAQSILSNEAGTAWREDRRRGVGLLDDADRLLEEAERLDPDWIEPTLLRIEAAETKAQLMGGAGTMDRAVLRAALDHVERALVMTADSAPLLERRGTLRFTLAEYSDAAAANELLALAEADLRAASRLDPERPRTWLALSQVLERRGTLEGAYEYAVRAYETDSFMVLTAEVLEQLVSTALNLERIEEATHWCLMGRRLMPRDQGFAQWRLSILASLPAVTPRDIEVAWAYVDTLVASGMSNRREAWTGYGQMVVAITLATAGRADSADAVIGRARKTLARHGEAEMQAAGAYFEAVARLRLGQLDAAYDALSEYVDVFGGRAESLRSDWWFRELWDDPRFIRLYGGSPTEALGGS